MPAIRIQRVTFRKPTLWALMIGLILGASFSRADEPVAMNLNELFVRAAKLLKNQIEIIDIHQQFIEVSEYSRVAFLRKSAEDVLEAFQKAESISRPLKILESSLRMYEWSENTVTSLAPKASEAAFKTLFAIGRELGRMYNFDYSKPQTTKNAFTIIEARLSSLIEIMKDVPGKEAQEFTRRLIDVHEKVEAFRPLAPTDDAEVFHIVLPISLELMDLYPALNAFSAKNNTNKEIKDLVIDIEAAHDIYIDAVRLARLLDEKRREQVKEE